MTPTPGEALILVDLQNDFLPGGALAVPEGDEVLPLANRLLPLFELVVATRDHHPANHISFASNHPGREPFSRLGDDPEAPILWPDHCVQGTAGASLAADLDQQRIARVFAKGEDTQVDCFSGFGGGDRSTSTGLGDYLRSHRVTTVYLLGLATDYCVLATALDAVREGFTTFLIEDACRGISPDSVARATQQMQAAGVRLVSSDALIEQRSA